MDSRDVDPPALRSIAIFDLTQKATRREDIPAALEMVTTPLFASFQHHRFLAGTYQFDGSAMLLSIGVDGERFLLGICAQEPVSYEWTLSIDRRPPFWRRLFGSLIGLGDTPATRRLLGAVDEGLRSDANVSQVSWHKRAILTPWNLSSAADSPF